MNGSPWFAYIFFSSFILFFLCSAFLLFIWNFLSALHYLYSRSCLHTWISLNLKMTMLFAWLIAKCCMRIFSFAFGLCHYCVKFFAYFLASFCHSHRVAALFFPSLSVSSFSLLSIALCMHSQYSRPRSFTWSTHCCHLHLFTKFQADFQRA